MIDKDKTEERVDNFLRRWCMKLTNRKGTALIVLIVVVSALVIMLSGWTAALAHHPQGKMAKDGCHMGKTADYRHTHWNVVVDGKKGYVEVPCKDWAKPEKKKKKK